MSIRIESFNCVLNLYFIQNSIPRTVCKGPMFSEASDAESVKFASLSRLKTV